MLCAMDLQFDLYYNVVTDSLYNQAMGRTELYNSLKEAGGSKLRNLHLRYSPNAGKDLGGKMVLLDSWLRGGSTGLPMLFLHDKRSPHKPNPADWSNKLQQVAQPGFAAKAIRLLNEESGTVIIAANGTLMRDAGPTPVLDRVAGSYNLGQRPNLFVAGTMFWCRPAPMRDFFGSFPPLGIRATLEKGNVLDEEGETITHCWERLLSGILTAGGGSILELETVLENK